MDLQDQQQLVSQAQQSAEGFGKLYDYYFPKVYAFVASRVHDRDDAEDLTSEVFMKILENIDSYQWRGVPFGGWLFKIARNCLNSYYASHAQSATTDLDEVDGLAEDEEKVSPHQNAARNELAEKVRNVMKGLPEREMTVVQLKFFSQLNNREIMEVTGLSESNVGIILFRTLKKIKPQLTYFA
jgi:RNA polymerase sigma-70 factor (ECF subfamily)